MGRFSNIVNPQPEPEKKVEVVEQKPETKVIELSNYKKKPKKS